MSFLIYFISQLDSPVNAVEGTINLGQEVAEKSGLLNNPFVLFLIYLVFLILILLLLFNILKLVLRRFFRLYFLSHWKILLVTVPKESLEKEAKEKKFTELLERGESFYDNVGGLHPEKGLKAWLYGRQDHFCFEIVKDFEGLISFYVVVPARFQQIFEKQIHSHYPSSHIEEVSDYNIFPSKGVTLGCRLKLSRHYIFPIKTYKQIGSDPLEAITNSLSKLGKDETALIQIVARSAHRSWHEIGAKVATEMEQGKSFKQAMREATRSKTAKFISDFFNTFESVLKKKEKKEDISSKEPHKLSPMEEETIKNLEGKAGKAGFDVNIRILVSAPTYEKAQASLRNVVNSFSQFTFYKYGNGFKVEGLKGKKLDSLVKDAIYRLFNEKKQFILNTEEMVSIYHFPLPTTETPNIRWLLFKKLAPPANLPTEGLLLGESIYRGVHRNVYLKRKDRRRHLYIIGMTGVGKSVLISNLAIQDIQNGEGVCVIDPHGDLIESILPFIPKERAEDVILFDPSDVERPIGLNMLEAKTKEQRDFAVQEMIAIFYKLFPPEIIGPMFEHNMRNVMLTLMADTENPGTIAEIPRMFSDPDYQKVWIKKVKDPVVKAFWEKEMARTTDFHKSEMLGYLISKVGRFVENEMMRNIIGQSHSGFNFREVMDKKKILLVNLAKGKTGEVNSSLLGLIIVSKLQMATMARAELPEEERGDFYLYIDEFQNFITDSIATILAEARKYRLNLTIAHQYIGQLVRNNDTKIRDAVFGNVGTIICFRIGVDDAETLAKQLAPTVSEYDVMNIEKYNAYVRLLVDNAACRPFNMHCFPPPKGGNPKIAQLIKELSRLKYGRDRKVVEKEILERSRLGEPSVEAGLTSSDKNL